MIYCAVTSERSVAVMVGSFSSRHTAQYEWVRGKPEAMTSVSSRSSMVNDHVGTGSTLARDYGL